MFIGEYQHSIDEKGRLAVPVKFRDVLAEGAVVTRGLGDNCLFLYTNAEWEKVADRIANLSTAKANSRAASRLMLGGAMDVKLDKQGRIILPEYLKKYAELKKKVVIAGLYDRLEIWDAEVWEQYKKNAEKESKDIAEALGELKV
ncbi:MAG TPA: division/cell wall cluster transcriptional repressor MraZ [Patescibacteria group bacterium]|nr:division/cell wall cluster transcriptional repressor MraZ [Patescibacteria group bacterium]